MDHSMHGKQMKVYLNAEIYLRPTQYECLRTLQCKVFVRMDLEMV